MKLVIQRVTEAALTVAGEPIAKIGKGLVAYLGVAAGDTAEAAAYCAKKLAQMRIFEDENGKMNLALRDICGEILLVSQFTLLGNCKRGNRPDFTAAEAPEKAKAHYENFAALLRGYGIPVALGVFGADMQILQSNDGPVTILLSSDTQNA